MSWDPGYHCPEIPVDLINKSWENKKGDLAPDEARDWFVKFLACNPYFAAKLLIGGTKGDLYPIQEILIRTWFQRKRNMLIAGRGFSKSYTTAIFVVLYALMNPGSKIGIFSASFRQAKLLFTTIEEFVDHPEAGFLRQCVDRERIRHSTDAYEMIIGDSSIKALPLTEKTRGLRMNLVIIDEYLSVPEKIVQEIIGPMLAVKRGDTKKYELIQEGEDILVAQGKMKEWERTKFPENKTIMLSSASYEMDSLYQKVYKQALSDIRDPEAKEVSNSVIRLSWECAPPKMLDYTEIESQKKRLSKAQFDREYGAIFTRETGGFFNIKDIDAATVEPGCFPKVKLKGDPDKTYILSIDPTFSAGSEEADDFAISVIEMEGDDSERGFLVHAYAIAKSEIRKRTRYLEYLLNNFNVRMIVADNAGGPKFIEEFSALHPDFHTKLTEAAVDFDTEESFQATKHLYNPASGAMVFYQVFNKKGWIRDANEALQADIQHKRMMFASVIRYDDAELIRNMKLNLIVDLNDLEFKYMDEATKNEAKKMEFIEHVDERVENTRKELTLIEMKSDTIGNVRFDLPKEMKQSVTKNKARRDSYTSLLIGNMGRRNLIRLRSNPIVEVEEPLMFWVN